MSRAVCGEVFQWLTKISSLCLDGTQVSGAKKYTNQIIVHIHV